MEIRFSNDYKEYSLKSKTWEDISEEEPDEFDLEMISEIEKDPNCTTF